MDEIKLTQVKSTERILLYVGIVVITAHFLITQFSLNYWISSLEPCKAQVWDEIQHMSSPLSEIFCSTEFVVLKDS